jgi:hypothetical protein
MEPGGSLPHSQERATCPYPEPAQSSPCPPPMLFVPFLIIKQAQVIPANALLLLKMFLHYKTLPLVC